MQEFTNVQPFTHVGRLSSVPEGPAAALPGLMVMHAADTDVRLTWANWAGADVGRPQH